MTATETDMHVAFFNRSYYPDQTATGQLLTDLSEDLVRDHGCRVSVVVGPPLQPLPGRDVRQRRLIVQERRNGVEIHRALGTRFDKRRFVGRAANYVSYFLSATWAGLRLDRPDVVVALTDPPIIGLSAWLAGRRQRAPLVMAFNDLFPEVTVLLPDFHSTAVDNALQRVNQFLVRRAAMNIALGDTMRSRLVENKGAPGDRVRVIPSWADTSAIVPGDKNNAFAVTHGLADRFVVMHSGNMGLSQELETLVDAAALLCDLPDLMVVFQGDGALKPDLEARVGANALTNVLFLPFAPRADLGASFASADVFVISLQRGLAGYIVPSKLYGILAAGRPYVAAVEDTCEVASITRTHRCGVIAEPGNARDLAARIRELYLDRGRTARLGERARQASQQFDRRLQVSRYMDVLREVRTEASVPTTRTVSVSLAKRALDVVLSGAGLLLSLPLWVLAAIAIKLEDGGPVFYGQERVGQAGRRFRVLKFRSMVPRAEAVVGALQASADDPRVTRVGRLMRATAFDELPQLLSIFKGDMSLVGPRALRPGEIEVNGSGQLEALEDVPGFAERCRVRPGLTGVAQIYAPRDLARRQKFRFDRVYIRRQSFFLDVRLILLSFWITFRGTWESRGPKF